mmetsp:Transcript_3191/g.7323  ORF Transcript_3191/g.7323 Transcript_3191/m.7323 type:complete len:1274 (+) Transcript_3191:449-4270(+)
MLGRQPTSRSALKSSNKPGKEVAAGPEEGNGTTSPTTPSHNMDMDMAAWNSSREAQEEDLHRQNNGGRGGIEEPALTVVVVGHEKMGKTSFVKRLIGGTENSSVSSSSSQHRAVGLDEHDWSPPPSSASSALANQPLLNMKVWDLTGQQNFHVAQELLFTTTPSTTTSTGNPAAAVDDADAISTPPPEPSGSSGNNRIVFIVVWDLAAQDVPLLVHFDDQQEDLEEQHQLTHPTTALAPPPPIPQPFRRGASSSESNHNSNHNRHVSGASLCSSSAAFKLGYDSDSDSDGYDCEMEMLNEDEIRRQRHAIEEHIDQRVQFWIDRIQKRRPGATIIPVMTHSDLLLQEQPDGHQHQNSSTCCSINTREAKKRCKALKERLVFHEERTVRDLEERIRQASSGGCCGGEPETFRFIKQLSKRPNIVFGGGNSGCAESPFVVQTLLQELQKDSNDDNDIDDDVSRVRQLLISTAHQHMKQTTILQEHQSRDDRHMMKMLRYNLKSLRQKNAVVIRIEKLAEFVGTDHIDESFRSSLQALAQNGEICYFGGRQSSSFCSSMNAALDDDASVSSTRQLQKKRERAECLEALIVLKPTWLLESVDAILRHVFPAQTTRSGTARRLSNEDCNGNTFLRRSTSVGEQVTNLPYIDRQDVWNVWIKIFEQDNGTVDESILNFLEALLVENDVLVPLTLAQNLDAEYFFLPSLVSKRRCSPPSETDLKSVACHGLVFMDAITPSFIERILVRLMKCLGSSYMARIIASFDTQEGQSRGFVKEFHSWRNSYRITFGMARYNEGKKMEHSISVESRLIQSNEFCSSSSGCRSMLVTSIEGCENAENCELWKATANVIRRSLFKAVEESPGLEYQDVAVCPDCFSKKPDSVDEIATWAFSKVKTAIDDGDDVIRCKYGHSVGIKHVKGLLSCQFDQPTPPPSSDTLIEASSLTKVQMPRKDAQPALPIAKPPKVPSPTKLPPKPVAGIPRSTSLPEPKRTESPSAEDIETMRLVRHRVQECEAKASKRRFFSRKSHLALDNLGLTEKQVPTQALNEGQLGVQLQSLSLANNKLSVVPATLVVCLPQLRALDLSNCLLFTLPKRWNLPQLKTLNLSCNMLQRFPDEEILTGIFQLEDLNLSNNKIKSVRIPSNPRVLGKLKNLDLSMNEISSSPSNLGRLKSLRMVDLNHNHIKEMPDDLTNGFAPAIKSAATSKRQEKRDRPRTKGNHRRGLRGDPRRIVSEGPDYGSSDHSGKSNARITRRSIGFLEPSRFTQTTVSCDDNSDHHR